MIILGSGLSYLSIFENKNLKWNFEIENAPCIICQEHKNLQNMKFDFQGSQKKYVRVAKSPNGLGKSISKTIYFSPLTCKSYVGPIGFHGYNI